MDAIKEFLREHDASLIREFTEYAKGKTRYVEYHSKFFSGLDNVLLESDMDSIADSFIKEKI